MKRLLLSVLFVFIAGRALAQCEPVVIPDVNFRFYLLKTYPNVMDAEKRLLPCEAAKVKGSMYLNFSKIDNLSGIEHFTSITDLNCPVIGLKILPALPPNLKSLTCYDNQLTQLPKLPATLEYIRCSNNLLTTLPSPLPDGLEVIECIQNKLQSLPTLPKNLKELVVWDNQLTVLPALPEGLEVLKCTNNKLWKLPELPATLRVLSWQGNNPGGYSPGNPKDFWY